ncbi:tetratricopeptide repeat protein [Aeromonas sp. MrichA-1]|uniref:tetratricopeptide repeat protein n=1 Tax=Aeromonas sp. MrichA-1 TaxID=2823362 RepID=UPI001B32C2AC|nr:tetratricopeptide repeat protein [Aeromonas sp. MrichA-1]MBP4081809.1 sel1 repeat family protein [Aeromonas sp. MrichA-1]
MKNNKKESISVNNVIYVVDNIRKNKKPNSKSRGLIKKGRRLLKEGDESAANLFGILYSDGILFKQDLNKAIQLFLVGEKTNNYKMICNAGKACLKLSRSDELSEKERDEMYDKAVHYATRAANSDYVPGIMFLAMIYQDWMPDGIGTDVKYEDLSDNESIKEKRLTAKELYEKAIALGEKMAILKIADMYFWGDFEDDDIGSNAREWLFRAVEENIPSAFLKLGELYASKTNYVVEHDELKAFTWTLKAAEAGDEIAMFNLIGMYRDGIGVEKDSEKSLYWKNKIEALPQ